MTPVRKPMSALEYMTRAKEIDQQFRRSEGLAVCEEIFLDGARGWLMQNVGGQRALLRTWEGHEWATQAWLSAFARGGIKSPGFMRLCYLQAAIDMADGAYTVTWDAVAAAARMRVCWVRAMMILARKYIGRIQDVERQMGRAAGAYAALVAPDAAERVASRLIWAAEKVIERIACRIALAEQTWGGPGWPKPPLVRPDLAVVEGRLRVAQETIEDVVRQCQEYGADPAAYDALLPAHDSTWYEEVVQEAIRRKGRWPALVRAAGGDFSLAWLSRLQRYGPDAARWHKVAALTRMVSRRPIPEAWRHPDHARALTHLRTLRARAGVLEEALADGRGVPVTIMRTGMAESRSGRAGGHHCPTLGALWDAEYYVALQDGERMAGRLGPKSTGPGSGPKSAGSGTPGRADGAAGTVGIPAE